MKRIVITGFGILSSIGNNLNEVLFSLKNGRSGISFSKKFKEFNIKSNVWGNINFNENFLTNKKNVRFMNLSSMYAFWCMKQAILDANLTKKEVSNYNTGLIIGSSIGSPKYDLENFTKSKKKNKFFISPFLAIKTMFSNVSACLGTFFKIKGVNYSISSACSSSANCIVNAIEIIKLGRQNIIFAGGSEELCYQTALKFDSMGALSTHYNKTPKKASRAYDFKRDGFVVSGGCGIIVLEELKHALKRKAKIYGEFVGYATTSDGLDMVYPSGKGLFQCMNLALKTVNKKVDYLNTHGTSTKIGDIQELYAIKKMFGKNHPDFSSTKSITGHSLGTSGVHEVIYSIIMLLNNFIAPSINIEILDKEVYNMNLITEYKKKKLFTVMTNSCGFGGVNVSLVIQKYNFLPNI